jgi:hypothetical protein
MGDYMYSSEAHKIMANGSSIKPPKDENLLLYTTEALKSGLSPKELTKEELKILIKIYGNAWYERFGYEKEEVPVPDIMLESGLPQKISRQERRLAERKAKKREEKGKQ